MDKAYDIKALGEMIVANCKAEGLPVAEEAIEKLAVVVLGSTMDWLQKSAELSDTPVDNFVVPLLTYVESAVKPQIDKIDLDGDGD
jgi:hypothetical protein